MGIYASMPPKTHLRVYACINAPNMSASSSDD